MEWIEYSKSVAIRASMATLSNYLEKPTNLPDWTKFFREVQDGPGPSYQTVTKFGPARVWTIEKSGERGSTIELHTQLGTRTETAAIVLTPQEDQVLVEFHTRLPSTWSEQQVHNQLDELHGELQTLRNCIEIANSTKHDSPRGMPS